MNDTATIARTRTVIDESLFFALFRVSAIAELKGPAKAVEWVQSLLDDEQFRAAFVAGVTAELASRARATKSSRGGPRPDRRRPDAEMPLIHFGRQALGVHESDRAHYPACGPESSCSAASRELQIGKT